ncbi:MAG: TetR/AcrR family transcriptional regulator [Candidatus Heimdallarchaeota archaeon]
MSKTRARSPEKKAKKFQKIIAEGKKLFLKYGSEGFSMRAIAKKLDMQQGNLYNYVQSKRELWFAVVQDDFQKFASSMEEVITTHQGTSVELLIALAKFYIDFALEDYDRYKMMFLTPAPLSSSIGSIEKNYQPLSFDFMLEVVQQAVENKEIVGVDTTKFTMFIWGIVHGNVSLLQPEVLFPQDYARKLDYQKEFCEFLLEQIKRILQQYA